MEDAVHADRAILSQGGHGCPPVGLERMLHIYFLEHWFNLSDPGAEEALYESRSMCRFVGIDLGREPVPDETTILNFRHLLEQHGLVNRCFRRLASTCRNRACALAAALS
jgi:transposase, IS5 family